MEEPKVVLSEVVETEPGKLVCRAHSARCIETQRLLARSVKLLKLCRSYLRDLQAGGMDDDESLMTETLAELDRFLDG